MRVSLRFPSESPAMSLPARSKRTPLLLSVVAASTWLLGVSGAAAAEGDSWAVVGHQGLVQVVIAPKEHATDFAAYQAQISKLCAPERTCFVNFFTNTSGAEAVLPLPDAIAAEATARFRRSMKNGVEVFQWSCRLGLGAGECF
jgi:hypothetical protein